MLRLVLGVSTFLCMGQAICFATAPANLARIEAPITRAAPVGFSLPLIFVEQDGDARVRTRTATYNILAHVVTLPDGTRLEAHSGLGQRADDPRFVHLRMRGSTPPALYELKPRERLFHGVAALRLLPLLGNVFGRTGLLAHTYMLRGQPASNGCVVFRDYSSFQRAYLDGRIQRLLVIPSADSTALPSF